MRIAIARGVLAVMATGGSGAWAPRAHAQSAGPPETAVYLGIQRQTDLLLVHGLDDRAGASSGAASRGWLRAGGQGMKSTSDTGLYGADSKGWLLQGGAELGPRANFGAGEHWHVGAMASYAGTRTDATALGTPGTAHGDSTGYGLGLYGTWFQDNDTRRGWYADVWGQYAWFDNRVDAPGIAQAPYNSHVSLGSLETGYAFALDAGGQWLLTPQAQVVYVHNHAYFVAQSNGLAVQGSHRGGYLSRLGLRLQGGGTAGNDGTPGAWRVRPYGALNWWHDSPGDEVVIDQVSTRGLYPNDRFEIKGGADIAFSRQWRAWGDLGLQTGRQSFQAWTARAGASYSW